MFALWLGLQVLVLVAMVAVSAWGRKRIDPEARLRVRAGPTGIDWTMSKKSALVMTPLIGFLIVLSTFALRESPNRDTIGPLGLAVMVIFLLAHRSSVRRAGH